MAFSVLLFKIFITGLAIYIQLGNGDFPLLPLDEGTIMMKGLNLTGVVPPEFGNLSHLVEIDLTRNYLSGTIPGRLAELHNLRNLSLLGNRLSGSIPDEIGNIYMLVELNLEDNLLGGPLPQNLGNLRQLKRLLLSGNNFTGRMPETFGNLGNLTDFRIDGSRLSGRIPDFIGNWTNMGRLDLQGTSMKGPIPGTISLLTSLEQLRISDLSISSSNFPNVRNLTKIRSLVLRNCLITGPIPAYLGELPDLKTLDLTFNRLTGTIPSTLEKLKNLQYMFLTNNSLSGEIPSWILDSDENKHLDLSYNNFTGSSIPEHRCSQRENLVSSHSFSGSNKDIPWCMRKGLTCDDDKPRFHSLFINCGGPGLIFENNEYEEDSSEGGAASFVSHAQQWAYSSTGVFMDRSEALFIATNNFNLSVSGPIYENARLAPLSLKYYGLCLRPGSYKVQLHFAEIMYTDDHIFSSLGRRIFDVSIQGNVVMKDFNIMEKAGRAGHGIIQEFDNVTVDGSTLEIHLYWAGKGTRAIPDRGVYGPLISAVTVTPNFEVDDGRHGFSVGGIIGVAAASCVALILLILIALLLKVYSKRKEPHELSRVDLQTGHFTLRQIKHATNNFDPASKIGEGGFGPVYRGVMSDGAVVAIKQLSSKSKQGSREFVNEVGTISALRHPNLVRLYGCCVEGNQLLLIYEYLENNSLARALFGGEDHRLILDWQTRMKILLGVAKGLAYLHEESRLKIVHRDIKPSNVLLDNAKISDFGLAKLDEQENTHISTQIAGTIGYMAPEYAMRGYLTDKADVYSFGVVLLEVVSGKSNTNYRPKEEFVYLLDWAYVLQDEGNLLELVDPNLGSNYSAEEAGRMLTLALLCTNPSPTLRPSMSSVVSMIEGKLPIQAPRVKRGSTSTDQDARFKALEIQSEDSQDSFYFSQKEYASMGGPMIGSSSSPY